jgi:DNA-directed RNA polymerase subunit RPC12/RpoP
MTHTTMTGTTAETTACAECGRTVTGAAPLDWVLDVDTSGRERVVRYQCTECARTNLRSIEAGLHRADW